MVAPIRNRRGYTVVELVIVIIVLGILGAFTYVRLAPALERGRVRGAASVLAGDLQYAQVLAARLRVPVTVTMDGTAITYQIAARGGTVYRSRDLGSTGDYGLDELTASPTTLEVFPNAIAAQSATYTFGLNGYRQQVTFSRAGQIRVTTVP